MALRSRGIKVDLSSQKISEKIYFDPIDALGALNPRIASLLRQMPILEYSIRENGQIDSINFHTECKPIESVLSLKCISPLKEKICQIFDDSFKAYTLGFRFVSKDIVAESVYYYPTKWKINRYGISGITEKEKIDEQIARFANIVNIGDSSKNELSSVVTSTIKFKGVCITTNQHRESSYKLYFRIDEEKTKNLINRFYNYEEYKNKYGETVLVSIRIDSGLISGYNFYYLK